MINFRKSGLNHQKPQFEKFRKTQWNAWIYAWKHEIKCKKKVNGLTGLERGKPSKKIDWKRQKKWRFSLTELYGERKGRKLFEKVFDPSEKLFIKNVPHDFRLIETNRGSLKNFEKISIDHKNSLGQSKFQKKHSLKKIALFLHKFLQAMKKMSKMYEYEMQSFSKTQVLNSVFLN